MLDEQRGTVIDSSSGKQLVIRTGCMSCRARGIRCDPKNAQCQRNSSIKWRSNRAIERYRRGWDGNDSNQSSAGSPGILNLNVTWQGTLREKESLHFFCVISGPELSGFLDTKFWQRLLPQASHLDDAIKHAVAAIGASHEYALRKQASRLNSETDGLRTFALRQCNKAINDLLRLRQKKSQGDLMRALTASVLFASFESLSGNRDGAIPHVVHSRKLIEQHKKNYKNCSRPLDFPVDLDTIEPLIAHYEVQMGIFVYEDDPIGTHRMIDLSAPLKFYRLADARVTLELAIASLSVVVWSLPEEPSLADLEALAEQKAEYAVWLNRWDAAFTAFLAHSSHLFDRDTLNGCRLLKAHEVAITALANVDYAQGELGWAAFTPQHRIVVDLMITVVENLPKRGRAAQVPQLAYLSSTMGMTEPLYCTATRCTDPEIAEEARSLMKKLPLNEGIHSAWKISYIEKTLCAATGKVFHESPGSDGSDTTISPDAR